MRFAPPEEHLGQLVLELPDLVRMYQTQSGTFLIRIADRTGALDLVSDAVTRVLFRSLMLARDIPVLHASAIGDELGRAVIFCGIKGAGKSTTAFGLAQRGLRLLADDNCPLLGGAGEFETVGSGKCARLTPAAIDLLGLERPQLAVGAKYLVPAPGCPDQLRYRIKAVLMLEDAPVRSINQCAPTQALYLLLRNLWNNFQGTLSEPLFQRLSNFCAVIPVIRVARNFAAPDREVDFVENLQDLVRALLAGAQPAPAGVSLRPDECRSRDGLKIYESAH